MDVKVYALRTDALGVGGGTDSRGGLEPVGLVGGYAGIADGLGEADLLWYWGRISYTRLSRVGRPRTRTTAGVVPACYLPLPYPLEVLALEDEGGGIALLDGLPRLRPVVVLVRFAREDDEGEERGDERAAE